MQKLQCCELRTSGKTRSGFCYECLKFPCIRLRQLDKRYHTKYRMSMIENLEFIRDKGIEKFLEKEETRWNCIHCGAVVSVHRNFCLHCKRKLHRIALEAVMNL
ncbi:MAG: hypothetical protein HC906_04190 [Bacteroidales bacterium]|nr:hypothetical protein [Bacteroidales bacterium]